MTDEAIRQPCKSCPWRVDQHAQAIPAFSLEKAEALASTCGDASFEQFACHQSLEGREVVCAGWLARYGWTNNGVRLALLVGRVNVAQLDATESADWPETHETFAEVIGKLRGDCA